MAEDISPEISAKLARLAELEEKEARREEEKALQARILAEPDFETIRNKILVGRIHNPEEYVPARDVFDYKEISKRKRKETGNKRISISEAELKAFQELKSQEHPEVTYEMVKESLDNRKSKITE